MTKEEILDGITCCTISEDADLDNVENFYFQYSDVLKAMEKYAIDKVTAELNNIEKIIVETRSYANQHYRSEVILGNDNMAYVVLTEIETCRKVINKL